MARVSASNLPGFNQGYSERAAGVLARSILRTERAMQRVLVGPLVDAIRRADAAQVAALVKGVQFMASEGMADDKLDEQSEPWANREDERHAQQFFRAIGLLMGWRVMVNDMTTRKPIRNPRTRRGAEQVAPAINTAPQVADQRFAEGIRTYVGKVREGVEHGLEVDIRRAQRDSETPEEAADSLDALWRDKGTPTDIGIRNQRNEEETILRVRTHIIFIVHELASQHMAAMNKARQTAAAIDLFRWRTQQDSRVRELHREFNMKVYTWAAGAEGWIPGEDFGCRCWAEAVADRKRIEQQGAFVRLGRNPYLPASAGI